MIVNKGTAVHGKLWAIKLAFSKFLGANKNIFQKLYEMKVEKYKR